MKYILTIGFLFASISMSAQQVWTLQQCISHAVAHNITIQRQQDNVRQQEIALSTARNSRLPNLAASAGENLSFGRGLTMDNTYANRNTQSTSFSLGTSVPLITGGQIPAQVRQQRLGLQAALQDCQKAQDDVTLNVISAYLEAVCQKELVGVAQRQVLLSAAQVDRMRKLQAEGKAAPADVAQMCTTLATDSLTLTQQENSLMLSLLSLTQLLELDTPEGFDVEVPSETIPLDAVLPAPDVVFAEAQGFKPQIVGEQLRLSQAQEGIAVARSALFPSLHFNAGIGTNYYRTSGLSVANFGSQMRDNFNQYLG
ncbi:MAG: TolC family protein, partial [Bacteroidaceae bacterium]|nr:TolC family protein [Bacteroidaceae bacterium]